MGVQFLCTSRNKTLRLTTFEGAEQRHMAYKPFWDSVNHRHKSSLPNFFTNRPDQLIRAIAISF